MALGRSFKEYVANRFYNELSAAVSDFIERNTDGLDVSSASVRHIDSAELSDITVKQVYVDDLPDMRIAFDVLVEAEFEIAETDRHNDRYDEKSQWFKISCTGDLACSLNNFAITNIEVYNYRNKSANPMSDSLVPVITKEKLEQVAKEFLEKYYREALYEPMAIDPAVLVGRMGLSMQMRHITSDFSVFGQIFFKGCEAEYYDKKNDKCETVSVPDGTIFVDPDAYFLRNFGSVNNTIVHECVHWAQHRKAFELERLYNENATQLRCQVVGGFRGNEAKSATDWMEWQANSLTPRIQMPYTQAKVKAAALIQEYKRRFGTYDTIDVMEAVIDEMALFFGVSRISAKIRMIDLGYEEAMGTFTYIDGQYVKPHAFKKGALQKNQTFSVSAQDAIIESTINAQLHTAVQSGNYIFVDSHFCINNPKYIETDSSGKPALTAYARRHADECCLAFDLSVKKTTNDYGKQFYTECVLYRDATSDIVFEAHFDSSKLNADVDGRAKMVSAYNKELAEILQKLPGSFSGTIKGLMEWKGVTVEALAEASLVSAKTIQRLRNDENYETTLETVIALCIGLQLPPAVSMDLLGKSKFSLKYTEQHIMYRFLLDAYYTHPIYDCNQLLAEQNFAPLTADE
ncbi:MAG: helix-turn-helix transcriptional regulator [Oscillospiraceae bacterium]|nr:helix-turn-helix transcriptional regulator [Oscillospiraceae bacterium]